MCSFMESVKKNLKMWKCDKCENDLQLILQLM